MSEIIGSMDWALLVLRKMGGRGFGISEIEQFSITRLGVHFGAQSALTNLEHKELVVRRLQDNPPEQALPFKLVWDLTSSGRTKADGLVRILRDLV